MSDNKLSDKEWAAKHGLKPVMTIREIARELGVSRTTVLNDLKNAISKLRDMEKKGEK